MSSYNSSRYNYNVTETSKKKVVGFLDDLRYVLDKHGVKLYTESCEVYLSGIGYVGYLEDNTETVDIIEEEEVLFTSSIKKI